jgi:asparagine synthase (glutamine-hydrolysing)
MQSASGRFVITFNGEIYNYQQLRGELEQTNVCWRGSSDTEVLLEAINAWGPEAALERIEGQFAFALWDRSRRQLLLARDRFGEKPLYYGMVGSDFVFASELKALRLHPDFRGEIDHAALGDYIRYGYVPHPRSIYRGLNKLPQGCLLRLERSNLEGTLPKPEPYWDLEAAVLSAKASPFVGSETEAEDRLDELLRRSVAARMVADVPVGGFLSGGVDSSLTVALMQAVSSRPVRTFTIGSWDRRVDEARHARTIAGVLATEHTELYVGPDAALDVIPKLGAMFDEPFADSSQIPTYLVAQMTRSSVAVALSGDGGDELFGGYNRYFLGQYWRLFMKLPAPLRAVMIGTIQSASPSQWGSALTALGPLAPRELQHGRGGDKLHKWADKAQSSSEQAFLSKLLSAWSEPETVLTCPLGGAADITRPDDLRTHGYALGAMYGDTQYYLPDDVLVKVDRASMATSLEVRTPFLDRSVFDFAWRLPLAMKINRGRGKQILRRVLARYVPAELFERPKQGFSVPIADWLRVELRDWAEALLDPRRLKEEGLLNPIVVRKVWDEHLSGRRNWDARLWTLLMFQTWLDGERVAPPADAVIRAHLPAES